MNRDSVKASQNIAAAIAHELRNPVFGIASAAQLLRYRIADDPVMEKNVGRILRDAERLNTLVEALLEYGRPAPIHLAAADSDEIWTDVLAAQRGLRARRALRVEHVPADPRAGCKHDGEPLAQAFGNVLANAVDAAPEGSDLTIRSATMNDGSWRSHVHNDGPPFAPDMVAHAFEPLVSTKPGHAGIGLAVAHRVVTEHGGTISIDSNDSSGTTVGFTLPPARLP